MLIAKDLVMTALHTFVRRRDDGSCEHVDPDLPQDWRIRVAVVPLAARLGGTARKVEWTEAEILWPTEPTSWFACDLALLKLKDSPFKVAPLAVAATDVDEMALPARFIGFPLAQDAAADQASAGAAENMPVPIDPDLHFLTELALFSGELTLRDKVENRRILTVAEGGDTPPGISGSVVLRIEQPHPPSIVGVVSATSSPSYAQLMENLGRDHRSLAVALLGAALEDHADLGGILREHGIAPAAHAKALAPPALIDHAALIDRKETCEGIASSIAGGGPPPGPAAPRAILTVGYVGEDDPYRALRTIASKLPGALKDVTRRGAPVPTAHVEAKPLVMRMPPGRLSRSDINGLLSHLEGGLGSGPGSVVVPIIVSGEIAGPQDASACLRETAALLQELAAFTAPLVLLLFLERGAQATRGAVIHDRLRAGAADSLENALRSLDFMGDLEWIDEHAIADWGATLLQVPDIERWSHLVAPRIDELRDRVYRLYANCPEGARAYPRLRRVLELIAEIQTSTVGTRP